MTVHKRDKIPSVYYRFLCIQRKQGCPNIRLLENSPLQYPDIQDKVHEEITAVCGEMEAAERRESNASNKSSSSSSSNSCSSSSNSDSWDQLRTRSATLQVR